MQESRLRAAFRSQAHGRRLVRSVAFLSARRPRTLLFPTVVRSVALSPSHLSCRLISSGRCYSSGLTCSARRNQKSAWSGLDPQWCPPEGVRHRRVLACGGVRQCIALVLARQRSDGDTTAGALCHIDHRLVVLSSSQLLSLTPSVLTDGSRHGEIVPFLSHVFPVRDLLCCTSVPNQCMHIIRSSLEWPEHSVLRSR
jgi:hypothetical protein